MTTTTPGTSRSFDVLKLIGSPEANKRPLPPRAELTEAVVEVDGRQEEVSVALVPAAVGARLLVHAGEAIACLDLDQGVP